MFHQWNLTAQWEFRPNWLAAVETLQREHRAEHFLGQDLGPRRGAGQQRRLIVEAAEVLVHEHLRRREQRVVDIRAARRLEAIDEILAAFLSGRIPRKAYGSASSPLDGQFL